MDEPPTGLNSCALRQGAPHALLLATRVRNRRCERIDCHSLALCPGMPPSPQAPIQPNVEARGEFQAIPFQGLGVTQNQSPIGGRALSTRMRVGL